MSAKFEYLPEDEVLLIRTSGTYDLEFEIDALKEIVSKAEDYKCSRFIVDLRSTNVILKTLPTYSRPQLFEELEFNRAWKAAMVFKELNSAIQFYENVFRNRGWQIGVFDDYDVAMNWLKD